MKKMEKVKKLRSLRPVGKRKGWIQRMFLARYQSKQRKRSADSQI